MTQARSSKLSKAEQRAHDKALKSTRSNADKDQVLIAATLGVTSGPEIGKVGGKVRGKVKGVSKSYEGDGFKTAAAVWAADTENGKTRAEQWMHMGGLFHALGWGEKKNKTDKKQPFHPITETFFAGMTKYRDEKIDEANRKSFNPRISEARRVMAGYIEKGKAEMDKILSGPGSINKKIASLKPRTQRAAQQTSGQPVNVADVAKAKDQSERLTLVAKMDAAAIGEVAQGLTADQLPLMAHAFALRCKQIKGALAAELGKTIEAVIKKHEAKHLKQVA